MQLLPIVYCKTSNNHLLIPFYPTSLHSKKFIKKDRLPKSWSIDKELRIPGFKWKKLECQRHLKQSACNHLTPWILASFSSTNLEKNHKKYSNPIFGMRFTAAIILTAIALLRWGSQAVGKSVVKGGYGCFFRKLGPDHHKRFSNFL